MPKRIEPKLPGPPPVPNHMGAKQLANQESDVTVTIDVGAFLAVWGAAEAGAKKWAGTESQKAFERARDSMRAAYYRTFPEALETTRAAKAPRPVTKPTKAVRKT